MHTRIRQRRVQTSQLRSVKRIIRAVVHPRKESHQALGTPGRAMSVNCSRDHLEPSHCPDLDRGMILLERIERIHARPLAGNNVDIARSNSSRWLTGISTSTRTVFENGGCRVTLLISMCVHSRQLLKLRRGLYRSAA
jgi:hypothetical protein